MLASPRILPERISETPVRVGRSGCGDRHASLYRDASVQQVAAPLVTFAVILSSFGVCAARSHI
jgi:hypothetical protein